MKNVIPVALGLSLLLCLLVGCTAWHMQTSLLEFVGEPAIWSAKKEKAVVPKEGLRLGQDDSIKTGETDNVWLRFGIDQAAMLGEGGELVLRPDDTQPGCELRTGVLLCRIDKPLPKERLFSIQAADALLETKSAVFSTEHMPEGGLIVNVYQGEVTLRARNTTVTIVKGQSAQLTGKDNAKLVHPLPIDYNSLTDTLAECVGDYAREALQNRQPIENNVSGDVSEPATDGMADAMSEPPLPESTASVPPAPPPSSTTDTEDTEDTEGTASSTTDTEGTASSSQPDSVELETAVSTVQPPPQVIFSYQWYENDYKPFADIRWNPGGEKSYIDWQLCDSNGRATGGSGRIDCQNGTLREDNYRFNLSSPLDKALFPKGYTLQLTAHVVAADNSTALDPVIMLLPYFDIDMEGDKPVPDTNIGVYFNHSYNSIAVTQQQDKVLVTAKLSPLKGRDVPLELNLSFD